MPRHNSFVLNDFKLEDDENFNGEKISDFRNEINEKFGNKFYKGPTIKPRVTVHGNKSR